jgi:hypothetical protein
MSGPCAYNSVASKLVTGQPLGPFFSATLISPNTEVTTAFDRALQSPSLKAKLVLDAASLELSASQGKDSAVSAVVRPNLKPFGVNVEFFPLKAGNFKISGAVPLCSYGTVNLSYDSEATRLTVNPKASFTALGSTKISADATFPGSLTLSAGSLSAAAYGFTVTAAKTPKVPFVGSVFYAGTPFSGGVSAEIPAQVLENFKVYGKYAKGELALATVLLIRPEKKFDFEVRAQRGCPCALKGYGSHGIVLQVIDGKTTFKIGGKIGCPKTDSSLAYEASTTGSVQATIAGKLPKYSAQYSVTAKWADLKPTLDALKPNFAVGVTLGNK